MSEWARRPQEPEEPQSTPPPPPQYPPAQPYPPPPQNPPYPPPGYPPPGYPPPGYPPPGYPPPGYPGITYNGMAIASMILGILWIYWIGSILALVFGYTAKKQIRERGELGSGMATAGIVLGWVGVGILLLVILAVILSILVGPPDRFEPVLAFRR